MLILCNHELFSKKGGYTEIQESHGNGTGTGTGSRKEKNRFIRNLH